MQEIERGRVNSERARCDGHICCWCTCAAAAAWPSLKQLLLCTSNWNRSWQREELQGSIWWIRMFQVTKGARQAEAEACDQIIRMSEWWESGEWWAFRKEWVVSIQKSLWGWGLLRVGERKNRWVSLRASERQNNNSNWISFWYIIVTMIKSLQSHGAITSFFLKKFIPDVW